MKLQFYLFVSLNMFTLFGTLLGLRTQTSTPHATKAHVFQPGVHLDPSDPLYGMDLDKAVYDDVTIWVDDDVDNTTAVNSTTSSANGTSNPNATDTSATDVETKTQTNLRGAFESKPNSDDADADADAIVSVNPIVDSDLNGKEDNSKRNGYQKSGSEADADDSRAEVSKVASKTTIQNEGMDAKTFDRLFLLILVTFIIIMGFFVRSFKTCRKEAKDKRKKARQPPHMEFRKRED